MTEIYRSEKSTNKTELKKGQSSIIPFGSEEWFEQAAAMKGDTEVQKNIARLLVLAFDTKNNNKFNFSRFEFSDDQLEAGPAGIGV